jgi:hypothetical protein
LANEKHLRNYNSTPKIRSFLEIKINAHFWSMSINCLEKEQCTVRPFLQSILSCFASFVASHFNEICRLQEISEKITKLHK